MKDMRNKDFTLQRYPWVSVPTIELMARYICARCCFEIVAPLIVTYAYHVHISAMFEGLHCRQNMFKVLVTFEDQIKDMEHKDFTLPGGFKVKTFLIGDFEMLDLVTSH